MANITTKDIGGTTYWYAKYEGSTIKLSTANTFLKYGVYIEADTATPGTSQAGTGVISINTSSSTQYINISKGFTNGLFWTINPVTTSNIAAANIVKGVTIQVGDAANAGRIANVAGSAIVVASVSTLAGMDSALVSANAGNYYIYTGTTGTSSGGNYYQNGYMYTYKAS